VRLATEERARATLSPAEAAFFHANGYVGPFTLCGEDDMARVRAAIEREALGDESEILARHIDNRVIWELCSHPAVVRRVAGLFGNDILIWSSALFVKSPGALGIPWHQDITYWHLEPGITVSAWLAIDPATVENSCVRLIPASHKTVLPKVPVAGWAFKKMADPSLFDESTAVDMELAPGQFFLFNERIIHGSPPNTSPRRRLGLSTRYTVPIVRVDYDGFNMYRDREDLKRVVVVSGEDTMNFNPTAAPPPPTGAPLFGQEAGA
jgi:ectoine hydroxylase-related dioxygenase (phytanoyl-CoA dioxygenase family)